MLGKGGGGETLSLKNKSKSFANKFDSKDATNIIKYMEKREIDNFMGTRQDLFTHTGIQEKDLNQIIFGKDWYIKDRSEN